MSHKHHREHHRSNTGGIIAIMVTIVVTGGLVYLGLSSQKSTQGSSNSSSDPTSMVGKAAPDFSLQDRNGTTYALKDLKGKNVVLFFNEGVMCYPACWNQVASLGSDDRFKGSDVAAFSVVVDSPSEWADAVAKMPELGAAAVLHDVGGNVSRDFGMLQTRSSMHYGQLPGHTYVVIDKQGIVRHVFDDPNMALHNDQLAEELEKLQS